MNFSHSAFLPLLIYYFHPGNNSRESVETTGALIDFEWCEIGTLRGGWKWNCFTKTKESRGDFQDRLQDSCKIEVFGLFISIISPFLDVIFNNFFIFLELSVIF